MKVADPKDAGVGCCLAGKALDLHVPLCRRCRQFRLHTAALQEEAGSARREERRGEGQEFRQRSQSSCGDERCRRQINSFDAARVHFDRRAGDPSGLTEKDRLALIGFDQIERDSGSEGQNQAWEASAGAEIDSLVGRRAHQWRKLK